MNKDIFRRAGLTDKETDVYLALLQLGQVTVGAIVKKTRVSSSKIYQILNRLAHKGLVSTVLKGKKHYFSAAQPQRLLDYLQEKKQEITKLNEEMEALIPKIEEFKSMTETQEAKVYIGYNGLRTGFDTILQTLKAGEGYVGFMAVRSEFRDPICRNIFIQYHKRRAEKGITAQLIGGKEMRSIFSEEPFSSYKKFQIRFIEQETLSNILIFKNHLWLYSGVGNPIGFILTSKQLADRFRKFFSSSWKIAKR